MAGPSYSILFSGVATGASSTPIAAGAAVCRDEDGDGFVLASTSNLATAGGRVSGISRTNASVNGHPLEIQYDAEVPAEVTGLGEGSVSYVGLNSSGVLVRQTYPYQSVGVCDEWGNLTIRNVTGEERLISAMSPALWLDANQDVTESSGAVSLWEDQSGNGRDFTAAGAACPTYTASQLSGLPGITFDGTDDVMACTAALSTLLASSTKYFTAYAVYRCPSIGTNAANSYDNDGIISDTGGFWGLHVKTNGAAATAMGYQFPGSDKHADQTVRLGVPHLSAWGYDGTNAFHRVDDALVSVDAATSGASTATGTLLLGRNFGTAFANATVHEILVFASSLGLGQQRLARRYLQRKWGL